MQFGGQVAYVIVNGNSMEPLYQPGDLVIVHRATDYQIGDIVTYRHPDIGPVIHRIIGQQGEQYLLKGDHNTWTDSYLPTRAGIIGKAWIHLPSVGKAFGYLRSPWVLSILVAGIGSVFFLTVLPPANKNQPRRKRRIGKGRQVIMKSFLDKWDDWLFVLAAIGIAAVALGAAAFTHPSTRTVLRDIRYQQNGVFTYSAPVTHNLNIYDPTGLKAGDPVFHQLVHRVNIQFDYQLVSDSPIQAQGSARLVAELSAADGWRQTIELQPATPFSGSSTSLSGILDLDAIQAVLKNLEDQTGIQRPNYIVTIKPEVAVKGMIGEQAIAEKFAPQLQFLIDPFELQMIQTDPTGPNPLTPGNSGILKWPDTEANTLSILGIQLQVLMARWIGAILLVLSLAGLAGLGIPLYKKINREDEAERIHRKYGTYLVSVSKGLPGRNERVKDVGSIDDLVKLAEKDGRSILHGVKDGNDIYFVQDTDLVYRHIVTRSKGENTA